MRTIQISTEVFAAIWKRQQQGEVSEDVILARILDAKPQRVVEKTVGKIGFRDNRFGVEFPEGFEIFRTYLGKDYRAKATGGSWLLMETGDLFPSLNSLSGSLGIQSENVWVNWLYSDAKGARQQIALLRDPSKVVRRTRKAIL